MEWYYLYLERSSNNSFSTSIRRKLTDRTTGSICISARRPITLEATLDNLNGASLQEPPIKLDPLLQDVREIAINCNSVLKDMIREFEEPDISKYRLEFVFIDSRGEIEKGRGSGVMREVLSIFWREFSGSLSTGAAEKVPCLRQDYQKPQWQSVARVIVAGVVSIITLLQAFITSCLWGEELPCKMGQWSITEMFGRWDVRPFKRRWCNGSTIIFEVLQGSF